MRSLTPYSNNPHVLSKLEDKAILLETPYHEVRLTFDKRFNFTSFNFASNFDKLIASILPFLILNDNNMPGHSCILSNIIFAIFDYSNNQILINNIKQLLSKYEDLFEPLKRGDETNLFIYNKYKQIIDINNVNNVNNNFPTPNNNNVYLDIKTGVLPFILNTILNKDELFEESFRQLFHDKKINFDIPIKKFLYDNFQLNNNDWKILYSCLLLFMVLRMSELNIASISNEQNVNIQNIAQLISIISDIDIENVKLYIDLKNDNKLSHELFNNVSLVETLFRYNNIVQMVNDLLLRINDKLFINNNTDNDEILNYKSYNIEQLKTFNLSTFNVSKNDIDIIINVLSKQSKCNILIYGDPGIGKTEFVKSIFKKLNKNFLIYETSKINTPESKNKTGIYENNNLVNNFTATFRNIQTFANIYDKALLIDECDSFINSRGFFNEQTINKNIINNILDNNISKNIWVSNHIDGVSESTFRRFDYVLKFESPDKKQKYIIWDNIIKSNNILYKITKGEIKQLVDKYDLLTPSYINNVISNAKLNNTTKNKTNFIYNVNKFASNIYKSIFNIDVNSNTHANNLLLPVKQYNSRAINIDYKVENIINSLKMFIGNKNKTAPMSMLFTGMPGTGKTELAKYLAKSINKPLLIKRYSDISNCYVGETEKNIAQMFKDATDSDSILLIDECDSLFQSRENAARSWEITQTNEMLTQMENYRGIVICTTNFLKNLDEASMRRFRWKIKFNALKYEDRIIIYKKYFNKKTLNENIKRELYKMDNLCFGDIKTVFERLSLFSTKFNDNEVINELKTELSYKSNNKSLGFY